ncbi:hypothetical protein B0H10DRAFT_2104051 [Mycena sp. CBHHK59/15]|nr:hypothetical protein B0H10DRAFT_2104051 [Mycena sp. CBHHK59/15]
MPCRHPWRGATLLSFSAVARAATSSLGFLDQSFYFDYNIASQAVPVPVTTQCETIHLEWSRGAGTGPDPTAPYFLQIYTSAFVFPFVVSVGSSLSFDWQVPFGPGTLYQTCMFDKNGNSGGCQAVYTMIANTTATPSCTNVTFPSGPLDIEAAVSSGPLSQYGWVDQCTDIQVTPKNGTPPYIFTIAPALHPPRNITGTDQSTLNWTVNLSWGSPFFISVVDSAFNFWAYGPLHSGQGTTSTCLSGTSEGTNSKASQVTAVASGIGGLIVGAIAGILATFFLIRHRRKRARGDPLLDPHGSNGYPYTFQRNSTGPAHYKALHPMDPSSGGLSSPSTSGLALQQMQREGSYQIEPFLMPGENPRHASNSGENNELERVTSATGATATGNIYVVHHDGGRAPVTVYHQEGQEVVELPPRYIPDSSTIHNDRPSDAQSEREPSTGVFTERRTSFSGSHVTPTDILAPQRRPNRARKP